MLRRRTLWPTRRRFAWPQRPRFRWPVLPSGLLIAPTYPTLTLPTDCGCCDNGPVMECCVPTRTLPAMLYLTAAIPCLSLPGGTIPISYTGLTGFGYEYSGPSGSPCSGCGYFNIAITCQSSSQNLTAIVMFSGGPGVSGLGQSQCVQYNFAQGIISSACDPIHFSTSNMTSFGTACCPQGVVGSIDITE